MASNATIGVKDFVYAVLTDGTDTASVAPAYGTIYSIANLTQASFATNSSLTRLYADDGIADASETVGDMNLSLALADIPDADKARMLGQTYANGQLTENKDDVSPYIAIGFKVTLSGTNSDGSQAYKYVWLPKCKVTKPGTEAATRESSVSYQVPTIDVAVINLTYSGNYMTSVRTYDSNASATLISNWFSSVVTANGANLAALTAVGAENSGDLEITLTKGSGNFVLNEATMTQANIPVIASSGLVPGTYAVDSSTPANTHVITFTPGSSLSGLDVGFTIGDAVKDLDGVGVTTTGDVITFS